MDRVGKDYLPGALQNWPYPSLGKAPLDAPLAYPGRAVSRTVQDKLPGYCRVVGDEIV